MCPVGGYVQAGGYVCKEWLCSGDGYPPLQTMDLKGYPPLLLTPSGSHHTYYRQAGGMHPTRMLSCLVMIFYCLLGVLLYHSFEYFEKSMHCTS